MKTTFPVEKELANRLRKAITKKHGTNYRFVSIEVEEMFENHIKKLNEGA